MKENILDDIDIKILTLLQKDSRISIKSIAEKVFVSQPTVSARIDALTEKGIIKGYYTEIDSSVYDNSIKCYIQIEVSPTKKEELCEIIRNTPQVIECDKITGEYSLILKMVFKNTVEMDKYINEFQHYGRTNTQIIFSSVVSYRGALLSKQK